MNVHVCGANQWRAVRVGDPAIRPVYTIPGAICALGVNVTTASFKLIAPAITAPPAASR